MAAPAIRIERIWRDIEALAGFSAGGPGVTRLTFSDEYRAARQYLRGQMEAAGMSVAEIPPGVMIGRLAPPGSSGPAVMSGSHVDTVLQGGRFDGIVGVVGALEVARVLAEHGVALESPYEVVIFPEEEGTSFGAVLTGSKAWAGQLGREDLGRMRRPDGASYLDAMERYGLAADALDAHRLRPGQARAFLELHIEQSVVLEEAAVQVGVVTTVTGIRGFDVTLTGVANHAGATPMDRRRDALAGASEIVAELERRTPSLGRHAVCTVGQIAVSPGARNVIPGEVRLSIDFRDIADLDPKWQELAPRIEEVTRRRRLALALEQRSASEPVGLAAGLQDRIEQACRGRGFSCLRMPSGAVHDAQVMAGVTDVGMIFVPSRDGRSHCPEEFTGPGDIERGASVLLDVVLGLARRTGSSRR
jgi:allantoate deiminase